MGYKETMLSVYLIGVAILTIIEIGAVIRFSLLHNIPIKFPNIQYVMVSIAAWPLTIPVSLYLLAKDMLDRRTDNGNRK